MTSYRMKGMKVIAAAKFKEKCLFILDHVGAEGITVTKHGKPVAVIFPALKKPSDFIGCLKELAGKPKGDIFSTGIKWHAES